MKSVLQLLLLLAALSFLAGCASTKSNADVDPNGETPSTIPWNRPESWEGGGALGGAMGN